MKRNMLVVFATSVALSTLFAPVATGQAEAAANLNRGTAHQFTKAPVVSKGTEYSELDALVSALGGESILASELQYTSMKKLDGEFSAPRWNAAGQLVTTRTSDEGAGWRRYREEEREL